jgi:hypothetical protein
MSYVFMYIQLNRQHVVYLEHMCLTVVYLLKYIHTSSLQKASIFPAPKLPNSSSLLFHPSQGLCIFKDTKAIVVIAHAALIYTGTANALHYRLSLTARCLMPLFLFIFS